LYHLKLLSSDIADLPTRRAFINQTRKNQMLNLTRNIGQSINIGNDVELIVLDVKANAVKIGVIAPSEISVHRKEVYDRIQLDKDVEK